MQNRNYLAEIRSNSIQLQDVPLKDLPIKESYEICLAAVKENCRALQFVPEEISNDEIYLEAIKQNGTAIYFIPKSKRSYKICSAAVKQFWLALQHVPEDIILDDDIYLEAVKQNGYALQYIPKEKFNREICLCAIMQNWSAMQFISKNNRTYEMYLEAIKQDWRAFHNLLLKDEYNKDKYTNELILELILVAVRQDVSAILSIPKDKWTPELYLNEEFKKLIFTAVRKDTSKINFIPDINGVRELYLEELYSNNESILAAVKNDASVIIHVPKNKWTHELYLAAIKENSLSLMYFKKIKLEYIQISEQVVSNYFNEREKIREQSTLIKQEKEFYVKSLRGDQNSYIHLFISEIVLGIEFPKRVGLQRPYTVTGEGIFLRTQCYFNDYPIKKPQYNQDEKSGFTNLQSTSYGNEFHTPHIFGFDKTRKNALVGVYISSKHVKKGQRDYLYDGGTINRSYDFFDKVSAESYAKTAINTKLFSQNNVEKFKQAVKGCKLFLMSKSKNENYELSDNGHLYLYKEEDDERAFYYIKGDDQKQYLDKLQFQNEQFNSLECSHEELVKSILDITSKRGHTWGQSKYNESMVRLRWACDDTCQIFIATDTLNSRLLAKQYARTLQTSLIKAGKCSSDYQVPIFFYIPESPQLHLKTYTENEYALDKEEAQIIFKNIDLRLQYLADNQYEFLLALSPDHINEALDQCAIYMLQSGYVHIYRFLLEKTSYNLESKLMQIKTDNEYILFEILNNVARSGDISLLETVLKFINAQAERDDAIIASSIGRGLFDIAKKLIESEHFNSHAKDYGYTALTLAADKNQKELVKLLLQRSTEEHIQESLFKLIEHSRTNALKLLLSNITEIKDCGLLPFAIMHNQSIEIIQLLLEKNINIEDKDQNGNTALHAAIINGQLRVVELLLQKNANVNAKNNHGDDVFQLAILNQAEGRDEIIHLLNTYNKSKSPNFKKI